jgi:hypothetical protein
MGRGRHHVPVQRDSLVNQSRGTRKCRKDDHRGNKSRIRRLCFFILQLRVHLIHSIPIVPAHWLTQKQ